MKRGVNECQRLLRCPDLRSKRSGHLLRFTLYPVANAHCHSHISIPTVLWIASSQYLPTNVGISIILRYQRSPTAASIVAGFLSDIKTLRCRYRRPQEAPLSRDDRPWTHFPRSLSDHNKNSPYPTVICYQNCSCFIIKWFQFPQGQINSFDGSICFCQANTSTRFAFVFPDSILHIYLSY